MDTLFRKDVYSAKKLFATEFNIKKAKSLAHDDELAEQLEAFTSRFCRLQDTPPLC